MARSYVCKSCREERTVMTVRGRLPKVCPACRGDTRYVLSEPKPAEHSNPYGLDVPEPVVPQPRTPFNSAPGRAPVAGGTGTVEDKLRADLAMMNKKGSPVAETLSTMALFLAQSVDSLPVEKIRERVSAMRQLQKMLDSITRSSEKATASAPPSVPEDDLPFGEIVAEIVPASAIDPDDPCQPLFSTPRRYDRPTWGPFWGRVAAALGTPYMPWQQEAANLAGEVNEQGRLCYNEVRITVPRQSGKTTLVLPVVVGRAEAGPAFGGRQNMLYAAQTRDAAKKKFLREYSNAIEQAKLMRGRFKVTKGVGNELLTFHASASIFAPIATKEESAHGEVLDFGALDEAFKQMDNRVKAAWKPATSTRPMSQIWIYSTMGDAKAVWFASQVAEGRAAARKDSGYGICYVEYAAPEDTPPSEYGNPELWRRVMPALNRTQSEEFIRSEYESTPLNDFRRAYLNQEVDAATDQVLNGERWASMTRTDDEAPRKTRPILVYDVAFDRRHATILIAFELEDGTPAMKVAEHGQGTAWVTEAVLRLRDELDPVAIVADSVGPSTSITQELKAEYVEVITTDTTEYTAACAMVFDGVENEAFVHYGERVMNKAVQGAGQRELGDAWAWTRKRSQRDAGTDISPLVALTLGLWAQTMHGDHAGNKWEGSFG